MASFPRHRNLALLEIIFRKHNVKLKSIFCTLFFFGFLFLYEHEVNIALIDDDAIMENPNSKRWINAMKDNGVRDFILLPQGVKLNI